MTTKTTHTPGPWKIRLFGNLRKRIQVYSDWRGFTRIVTFSNAAAPGATEANARLIAAAPDLLEAAQRLNDALAEDLPCECAKPGNHDAIYEPGETCPPCALRAAIAKATGQEGK